MAIFKFIAYSIITVFVLITLIEYTNPSTTYECDGQLWDTPPAAGGKLLKYNHKLFVKIIKHRWWISLLRGTRGGTLWVEAKGGFIDWYDTKGTDDISMTIYKDNEAIGGFSKISKKLYYRATKYQDSFTGYCKLN